MSNRIFSLPCPFSVPFSSSSLLFTPFPFHPIPSRLLHLIVLSSYLSSVLLSAISIDCITVSTLPVKAAIDDHIQQLFDALLQSLRHSIMTSVQTIDAFLTDAKKSLSIRPQSVEEIGEVNKKHAEIAKQKPQVSGRDV